MVLDIYGDLNCLDSSFLAQLLTVKASRSRSSILVVAAAVATATLTAIVVAAAALVVVVVGIYLNRFPKVVQEW